MKLNSGDVLHNSAHPEGKTMVNLYCGTEGWPVNHNITKESEESWL